MKNFDSREERNKFPVTVQLLIQKENKILLQRRINTGYEDGKYCFPGGHVETNEEIRDAMIREAKEEIGIQMEKEDLEVYKVLNRKVNNGTYIDFILKTNNWNGEIQIKEKDKCDELKWFDISEIPENVLPFIKEIFKKNQFYIPYGWE